MWCPVCGNRMVVEHAPYCSATCRRYAADYQYQQVVIADRESDRKHYGRRNLGLDTTHPRRRPA